MLGLGDGALHVGCCFPSRSLPKRFRSSLCLRVRDTPGFVRLPSTQLGGERKPVLNAGAGGIGRFPGGLRREPLCPRAGSIAPAALAMLGRLGWPAGAGAGRGGRK